MNYVSIYLGPIKLGCQIRMKVVMGHQYPDSKQYIGDETTKNNIQHVVKTDSQWKNNPVIQTLIYLLVFLFNKVDSLDLTFWTDGVFKLYNFSP